MRVIFGIFMPICLCAFVAFGISVAVLGVEEIETPPDTTNITGFLTEIDGNFSDIVIESNTVNVAVYPAQRNNTVLCVPDELRNAITADISDDTLTIKCNRIFNNFDDLWGFFTEDKSLEIEVYVPDCLYKSIHASANAGSTEINGIAAEDVYLDLTAGNMVYAGKDGHSSNILTVDMSAGNCELYNAATEEFAIDMSAGNMDVYGLSGWGSFELSAGNANVNFAEYNGNLDLDMSAGNLTVNLPADASADIDCDKSAGSLIVYHGDVRADVDDDASITIGDGKYHITAELSAGSINITDNVKRKDAPEIFAPPVYSSSATVTSVVVAATEPPVESSVAVDVSAADIEVKIGDIEVKVDPVSVDVDI